MGNLLYVDNSNVWIEGMHVSAVNEGMAPDIWTAASAKICDYNWKIDFGKLFEFAGGDKAEVKRAALFGSRPPKNDSLWSAAERKGFEVFVHDRNVANREKKVDGEIITQIMADSYEIMDPASDEITLVAGDGDYVPTIEKLKSRKIVFHVVFWEHASQELKSACTKFISLNPFLKNLCRNG